MAAKPDAVLIAGSGTPAALPQKTLKERGYTGKIYQTHGVANADFLRVCGKDCEGTFLPAGPMLVADQLPNDNPVKKSAQAYVAAYEAKYGKGSVSTFGGHAWDAAKLLEAAVAGDRLQLSVLRRRALGRAALLVHHDSTFVSAVVSASMSEGVVVSVTATRSRFAASLS